MDVSDSAQVDAVGDESTLSTGGLSEELWCSCAGKCFVFIMVCIVEPAAVMLSCTTQLLIHALLDMTTFQDLSCIG